MHTVVVGPHITQGRFKDNQNEQNFPVKNLDFFKSTKKNRKQAIYIKGKKIWTLLKSTKKIDKIESNKNLNRRWARPGYLVMYIYFVCLFVTNTSKR